MLLWPPSCALARWAAAAALLFSSSRSFALMRGGRRAASAAAPVGAASPRSAPLVQSARRAAALAPPRLFDSSGILTGSPCRSCRRAPSLSSGRCSSPSVSLSLVSVHTLEHRGLSPAQSGRHHPLALVSLPLLTADIRSSHQPLVASFLWGSSHESLAHLLFIGFCEPDRSLRGSGRPLVSEPGPSLLAYSLVNPIAYTRYAV